MQTVESKRYGSLQGASMKMTAQEWTDELAYCRGIVASGGDRNVPCHLIGEYLRMQQRSADREGFTDIGTALQQLLEDCPRTVALWRPGERISGVRHHFAYRGTMPCTGPLVCTLCGQRATDAR